MKALHQKIPLNGKALALALVALTAFAGSASAAVTIYSENFNGTPSYALNDFGWGAHVTSSALTNSGATEPTNWTVVNGGNGRTGADVIDAANVNAGTNNNPRTNNNPGFDAPARTSIATSASGSGPAISWTGEYTLDTSANTLTTIDFSIGNSTTGLNTRVAVRIGSSWYATDETFNQTNTVSSSNINTYETKSFTWTNAAASWRALTFDGDMSVSSGVATTTAGTALSLGSVLGSDLPGGDITGFGLFYDNFGASQSARTNLFQVNAIPEPSSLVLVAAGALGLAARRRRSIAG